MRSDAVTSGPAITQLTKPFGRIFFVLLFISERSREVSALDEEGNELWREDYSANYIPREESRRLSHSPRVFTAGDHVVFADPQMMTLIAPQTGDILATSAPGMAQFHHKSTRVRW